MGSSMVEGLLSSLDVSPRRTWGITACVKSISSHFDLVHRFRQDRSVTPAIAAIPEALVPHISSADVVVLATKPKDAVPILQNDHVQVALRGKLIISVIFGLTEDSIRTCLSPSGSGAYVISALPNIAAAVGRSATIAASDFKHIDHWPEETRELCHDFLSALGQVLTVNPNVLGPAAIVSGTMPAFVGQFVAGLLDGAASLGLDKSTAREIVLQGLHGTADLIQRGDEVEDIVAKVATKGGCTEAGLKLLREGRVRETARDAVLQSEKKLRGE